MSRDRFIKRFRVIIDKKWSKLAKILRGITKLNFYKNAKLDFDKKRIKRRHHGTSHSCQPQFQTQTHKARLKMRF